MTDCDLLPPADSTLYKAFALIRNGREAVDITSLSQSSAFESFPQSPVASRGLLSLRAES